MRMSDILQLLSEYAIWGIVVAAVMVFCAISYVNKKRGIKSGIKNNGKLLMIFLFICYLVILFGATLMSRSNVYSSTLSSHLLSSYKEAWYNFSFTAWRNLVLNILMFVPMGFLLPIIFKWQNRFWKVCLSSLSVSIMIELMQYITKRGVVEVDDVFNNTLGAFIGYGLLSLLVLICFKIKKKKWIQAGKTIILQIPFIGTILCFLIIFLVYQNQTYGNLASHYIDKVNMNSFSIDLNTDLSSEEKVEPVYQIEIASQEELTAEANAIFTKLNSEVNESQLDIYQDTIVYTSMDNNYSLWMDYKGKTTWFIDYTNQEQTNYTKYDENQVRDILKDYGIIVPESSDFSCEQDGTYCFSDDLDIVEDNMIDGKLVCTITEKGEIKEYHNNIIYYNKYENVTCISEKEAYELIQQGKFLYSDSNEKSISIELVEVSYEMDSKGFFQPVYEFAAKGNEETIIIPAIK